MHTAAGLLDIHTRTHKSLQGLLDHCAGFSTDELRRELDGFGHPTLMLQLDHIIGAEAYWVGVLHGQILTEELDREHESVDALRTFRERTAATTAAYLKSAPEAELNTSREMATWGGNQVELVPAHVILRTQTHVFQHQGQVAAMSRLLGRPIPAGLDFPLR